jgi:hypothetical protein
MVRRFLLHATRAEWIPACAGMTEENGVTPAKAEVHAGAAWAGAPLPAAHGPS